MRIIIEYFIKHHKVTTMIVILIFLAGIFSTFTIQKKTDPDASFGIVKITTFYSGAAPEDVEINVTNKLEDALLEVEDIKRLSSLSMENVSIISAVLNMDVPDQEKIKSNIREAVGRASGLPESAVGKTVIEELGASSLQLMEISITGDIEEIKLRKYAKELEERCKSITGVSRIEKIGYRDREIKIDVDMDKMKYYNISFGEIMSSIRNRNVRVSGGTIESFVSEKNVLTLSEYHNPLDVENVIIRSTFSGRQLRIKDVAVVKDDFAAPQVIYRGNGKNGIALYIMAQSSADNIKLSDALKNEINSFKEGLPEEISVNVVMDTSDETRTMLGMLASNFLIGFILVLLVMFMFLDVKNAFWAAFGIPFSIFGAFILFKPLGIQFHSAALMTIIIVLGIVVDDAIVITEKIYQLKQKGLDNYQATIQGAMSMAGPVSASVLTTIIGFGTLLFIGGIFGKFLYSIPVVVFLILGFSLVDALLFVPAHVKNISPPRGIPFRMRWLEYVKEYYEKIILSFLKKRWFVIFLYIAVAAGIMTLTLFSLKFVLVEIRDYDYFNVIIEAPLGTSLSTTTDMVMEIEKLIEETVPPEILNTYTTQVGHHNTDLTSGGGGKYSNWALILVTLVPSRDRKITCEEVMESLKKSFKKNDLYSNYKRLDLEFFGGLSGGKAIDVAFITNDDTVRNELEKEVVEFLGSIDGVKDIQSSNIKGKDEVRLTLDYGNLAKVRLTALDVAQTVRTAFDGSVVTSIRKDGEDIEYRVRIKEPEKFRTEKILSLPIVNKDGRLINLSYVASLSSNEGMAVIKHEGGKRAVTVTANVDSDKITSTEVNQMISDRFNKRASEIPGLHIKFSGEMEETINSMIGFLFALAIAAVAIYFILVVVFDSYLQPILVMSVVPFSLVGVFLTLFIHGMSISIIPLIGIIGLIGVVVNDTIVLISHLNKKIEQEGATLQVIAKGSRERFRPIILTTLTTFAGLLPTSYGLGGDIPTLRPMILVMAWGLVFATFITLGFTPLLYSLFTVRRTKKVKKEKGDTSKDKEVSEESKEVSKDSGE